MCLCWYVLENNFFNPFSVQGHRLPQKTLSRTALLFETALFFFFFFKLQSLSRYNRIFLGSKRHLKISHISSTTLRGSSRHYSMHGK